MLTDPQERTIVSSLGWADAGALWILDVGTSQVHSVVLADAKYLSLHDGDAGHFAVVHHYDDHRLAVTAHSFAKPDEVLSRCAISGDSRRIEGPLSPWSHLPRHYVAYLVQPAWSDFALVTVNASEGLTLQTFDWYDDSYDKGYQGVIGSAEIPSSKLILVSVQRSSTVILYDPEARRKVGDFALSGGYGNPKLHFRSPTELWADDYDTIVKVEPGTWRVLQIRKMQGAAAGTAQFIGQFAFDVNGTVCAVARPFSGDIVGLDPKSLKTRYRTKVGSQPLEVSVLRDGRVFARDWKTGNLLSGELSRSWFA